MTSKPAVLISGSAGGIGRATAEKFAREGWFVGVYDLDAAGAEQVAATLGAGSAIGGGLDVTQPEDWDRVLAAFTEATGGRLDLLINNAGVLRAGRLAETPISAHHLTIDVNVKGVINGCYAAYPYLRSTPSSGVINLCSASAIYGQADIASYSASKFAVRGLTEALELEWRKEDIRVQAVWPLWVNTGLLDGNHAGSLDTLGVHLSVEDVADQIYAMVRPGAAGGLLGRVLPRKVHTAVGLPAKTLATAADMVPSFVSREVNRRISRA